MAKSKVAIFGGGLASLSAAYELVTRSDDYEVTIYQTGWRLGGKCATGRNHELGERVEEHGIHLLFGCYENAFHLLRRAYADIGRPTSVLPDVDHAFTGLSQVNLSEEVPYGSGVWRNWPLTIPAFPGKPGDRAAALGEGRDVTPKRLGELAGGLLANLNAHCDFASGLQRPLSYLIRRRYMGSLNRRHQSLEFGADHDANPIRPIATGWRQWLMHKLLGIIARNDTLRRFWILFELGYAAANGLLSAWHEGKNFDDLDVFEFREWLGEYAPFGGLSAVTSNSAPLRMVYEVFLSYRGGDTNRPDIAAGAALRLILRIFFDRKGDVAYEMDLGTGETIVAPLYEALIGRGVKFRFFNAVRDLELDRDGKHLERVRIGVQATVRDGLDYDPLFEIASLGGLRCWPNTPRYEYLVQGPDLEKGDELKSGGFDLESPWTAWRDVDEILLERGRDFDVAILGISIGGIPAISQEICDHHASWRNMLAKVDTVATQSFQIWSSKKTELLGFSGSRVDQPTLAGSFQDPFANWVEMTPVLAWEDWPSDDAPKSLHYFSGALQQLVGDAPSAGPAPEFLALQSRRVHRNSLDWFVGRIQYLWPNLVENGQVQWTWIYGSGTGDDRFRSQYWRANVNPSDRYVPGFSNTLQYRLRADESPVSHLVLAGDWTRNDIDIGCVEAAVTSGTAAARAVLDQSFTIYGE